MVSKSKLWTCTGTARTGANPEKARCLHTKLDLGTVSSPVFHDLRHPKRWEVGCREGSPNKARALHGALGAAAAGKHGPHLPAMG